MAEDLSRGCKAVRAKILAAAKRLFSTIGFQETTIAKIASEADVSTALIYHYFQDKTALLEEIVNEDIDCQIHEVELLLASFSDLAGTSLSNVSEKIISTAILDRRRTSLMVDVAALASRSPRVQEFISQSRAKFRTRLRECFRPFEAAGCSSTQIEMRIQIIDLLVSGISAELAISGRPPKPQLFDAVELAIERLVRPQTI